MSTAYLSKTLQDVDFSEIDSRGFLHIQSFLDPAEIKMLRNDYETASLEENFNYSIRRISQAALAHLEEKCQEVIERTKTDSGVHVNLVNDGVYFATFSEKPTLTQLRPGPQKFPWHQDHENYWLWQDLVNYLNFYIPIVKPNVDRSNLALAPFDLFQARAPELYKRLRGRGATRVLKSGRKFVVKDDDQGGKVGRLDFDLAEIEETPKLREGDLLLMRGDLLHRTQDSSTRRIAASIRYINGQCQVHRSKLARGSLVKTLMMLNSRYLFEPAFRCFDAAGSDTICASEIDRLLKELKQQRGQSQNVPTCGRVAFLRRLAREKMR